MLGRFESRSRPGPVNRPQGTLLVEIQRPRPGLFASEPILMVATVIAVLYFGRPILIPIALAVTLNFLLAPAVIYLHRFRIRRVPAVIIVVVIAGSLIGGIGWVVARQLVRIAEDLPNYRANLHSKVTTLHSPGANPVSQAIRGVREVGQEFSAPESAPAATANPGRTPAPQASPPKGQAATAAASPVVPAPVTP